MGSRWGIGNVEKVKVWSHRWLNREPYILTRLDDKEIMYQGCLSLLTIQLERGKQKG